MASSRRTPLERRLERRDVLVERDRLHVKRADLLHEDRRGARERAKASISSAMLVKRLDVILAPRVPTALCTIKSRSCKHRGLANSVSSARSARCLTSSPRTRKPRTRDEDRGFVHALQGGETVGDPGRRRRLGLSDWSGSVSDARSRGFEPPRPHRTLRGRRRVNATSTGRWIRAAPRRGSEGPRALPASASREGPPLVTHESDADPTAVVPPTLAGLAPLREPWPWARCSCSFLSRSGDPPPPPSDRAAARPPRRLARRGRGPSRVLEG